MTWNDEAKVEVVAAQQATFEIVPLDHAEVVQRLPTRASAARSLSSQVAARAGWLHARAAPGCRTLRGGQPAWPRQRQQQRSGGDAKL